MDTDNIKSPPFIIPNGWSTPKRTYPVPRKVAQEIYDKSGTGGLRIKNIKYNLNDDGKVTKAWKIRNVSNEVHADEDALTSQSKQKYKLGLIMTNRDTLESFKCDADEVDRLWDLVYRHSIDCKALGTVAKVPDELLNINRNYYTYPYLRGPTPKQRKDYQQNGSCWTDEDWFPILGNDSSIIMDKKWVDTVKEIRAKDGHIYGDYRRGNITNLTTAAGEDKNDFTNIFLETTTAAHTPAHIWGDMSIGEWVSIDVASEWGTLGQRKHPKNLSKEEHYDAWNGWTNDYLLKHCVTESGNIILGSIGAKGYDAKASSRLGEPVWNQTYWPTSIMINVASLRPMLPLKRVIDANFRVEANEWNSKKSTETWTRMRVEHPEWVRDVGLHQGFIRTALAARYSNTNPNQYGHLVNMIYQEGRHSNFSIFSKNKKSDYRKQIVVWKPKRSIDFTMYCLGIIN
jgi:hypothetical protein